MKKVSLLFPTYDALWLFKERTNAINIRIEPNKNTMSGLFSSEEIDMALAEFHAIQPTVDNAAGVNSFQQNRNSTTSFRFNLRPFLYQVLSVFNF